MAPRSWSWTRRSTPGSRFSPSQLETYLSCPFQFFSNHVLDLRPIEEKDELDEDPTAQGSRIHDILESLETMLKQSEDDQLCQNWPRARSTDCSRPKTPTRPTCCEGSWMIDRGRLIRVFLHYKDQRVAYSSEARCGVPAAQAGIRPSARPEFGVSGPRALASRPRSSDFAGASTASTWP